MEPPTCPIVTVAAPGPSPSPEHDRYLAHLAEVHAAFLRDLSEVSHLLDKSTGHVAKVAAIHGRLAQQFLDAQRSIIRSRAVTDAEVADIGRLAEQTAHALVAAATDRAARAREGRSAEFAPPVGQVAVSGRGLRRRSLAPPAGDTLPVPMPAPARTVREEITQLGTAVVRSTAETESMARLIDEAFESAEPQGEVATRQLRSLLDSWWAAERQEDRAAIDDANARAAMRLHMAQVEANEVAGVLAPPIAGPAVGPATGMIETTEREQPVTVTPTPTSPMIAAFDDADHTSLDSLLVSLLDDLPGSVAPDVDAAIERPADEAESAVADDGAEAGPPEPFDSFWDSLSARRAATGSDWMFVQLMLPAVGVVAVLALILAVVG